MQSDPLFRKYLYATLSKYRHAPELFGRNFLESNTKIPVCCIEGEDDAGCKCANLRAHFEKFVKERNAHSRFYSFEKTGHAVFRARPNEYIAALKSFIE